MPHDVVRNPGEVLAERVRSELKTIASEYADRVPEDVIENAMEESVSQFREARVKDYVPLLAGRHTRRLLHEIVGPSDAGTAAPTEDALP